MTINLPLLPNPQLGAVLANVSRILRQISRLERRQARPERRSMNG